MTKKEYLAQLEKYLSPLTAEEKQDIILEIDERFRVAKENGETAKQVIAKIGTPEYLAQSYLKDEGKKVEIESGIDSEKEGKSGSGWKTFSKLVLAMIVIGVNIFFLLWLWFGLVAGLLATLAGAVAVFFSGVIVMAMPTIVTFFSDYVVAPAIPAPICFSSGLTIMLFALVIGLLLVWALIGTVKLFARYVKFNINLVKKA